MREGKWRVSRKRYAPDRYPMYCLGAAQLITGDVPSLLIRNMFLARNNSSATPEEVSGGRFVRETDAGTF